MSSEKCVIVSGIPVFKKKIMPGGKEAYAYSDHSLRTLATPQGLQPFEKQPLLEVEISDLTYSLGKLFEKDEIFGFHVRGLDKESNTTRRIAIYFGSSVDALVAQSVLDHYEYKLPNGIHKLYYSFPNSVKTKSPSPEITLLRKKQNNSKHLLAVNSHVPNPNHVNSISARLDTQIEILKKQKRLIEIEREVLKEKKKLKAELENEDRSDSDDEKCARKRLRRSPVTDRRRQRSRSRSHHRRSRSKDRRRLQTRSRDQRRLRSSSRERRRLRSSSREQRRSRDMRRLRSRSRDHRRLRSRSRDTRPLHMHSKDPPRRTGPHKNKQPLRSLVVNRTLTSPISLDSDDETIKLPSPASTPGSGFTSASPYTSKASVSKGHGSNSTTPNEEIVNTDQDANIKHNLAANAIIKTLFQPKVGEINMDIAKKCTTKDINDAYFLLKKAVVKKLQTLLSRDQETVEKMVESYEKSFNDADNEKMIKSVFFFISMKKHAHFFNNTDYIPPKSDSSNLTTNSNPQIPNIEQAKPNSNFLGIRNPTCRPLLSAPPPSPFSNVESLYSDYFYNYGEQLVNMVKNLGGVEPYNLYPNIADKTTNNFLSQNSNSQIPNVQQAKPSNVLRPRFSAQNVLVSNYPSPQITNTSLSMNYAQANASSMFYNHGTQLPVILLQNLSVDKLSVLPNINPVSQYTKKIPYDAPYSTNMNTFPDRPLAGVNKVSVTRPNNNSVSQCTNKFPSSSATVIGNAPYATSMSTFPDRSMAGVDKLSVIRPNINPVSQYNNKLPLSLASAIVNAPYATNMSAFPDRSSADVDKLSVTRPNNNPVSQCTNKLHSSSATVIGNAPYATNMSTFPDRSLAGDDELSVTRPNIIPVSQCSNKFSSSGATALTARYAANLSTFYGKTLTNAPIFPTPKPLSMVSVPTPSEVAPCSIPTVVLPDSLEKAYAKFVPFDDESIDKLTVEEAEVLEAPPIKGFEPVPLPNQKEKDKEVVKDIEKPIPANPTFVLPIKNLLRQMKTHIAELRFNEDNGSLAALEEVLRETLREIMVGKGYMRTAAIVQLFRDTHPKTSDKEFLQNVMVDFNNRKVDRSEDIVDDINAPD